MTATPKLLVPCADLSNASASLYLSPVGGRGTWIDKITALNHSGAAVTVTFNHVPVAGGAANSNLVVTVKSIAASATDLLPELIGKFIPPGAQLFGQASVATAIAFEMSGRELT